MTLIGCNFVLPEIDVAYSNRRYGYDILDKTNIEQSVRNIRSIMRVSNGVPFCGDFLG